MERVTGIEPADICLEGSVLTIEETPASEPPLGIEPSPLPYRGSAPPWSYDGKRLAACRFERLGRPVPPWNRESVESVGIGPTASGLQDRTPPQRTPHGLSERESNTPTPRPQRGRPPRAFAQSSLFVAVPSVHDGMRRPASNAPAATAPRVAPVRSVRRRAVCRRLFLVTLRTEDLTLCQLGIPPLRRPRKDAVAHFLFGIDVVQLQVLSGTAPDAWSVRGEPRGPSASHARSSVCAMNLRVFVRHRGLGRCRH